MSNQIDEANRIIKSIIKILDVKARQGCNQKDGAWIGVQNGDGSATQPNAPKTNPVEVALQQQALGLQLKQIEAQNKLANAETAKTLAEALYRDWETIGRAHV